MKDTAAHLETILKAIQMTLEAGQGAQEAGFNALKSARLASQFPKRCGCGLIYDKSAWGTLDFSGVYTDAFATMESRHCSCKSTIAVLTEIHDLTAE